MSFSTVMSAALQGLFVENVLVEADVSNGLPVFHMVGYLSSEVKEASERVRTAIRNSGFMLPAKKIVVNLAPANVRKRGASFDLPIALSVLCSLGVCKREKLERTMVIGELSLDGRIRKISGVLPIVMKAKESGCRTCILPKENIQEGALAEGIQIIGAESLQEICSFLNDVQEIEPFIHKNNHPFYRPAEPMEDFGDIYGQETAKRAITIAVAGGHNILFIGPPGSGKSMLAKRIPTILPPLSLDESMEITKIYSVMGMVEENSPLVVRRPFRNVHHTVTRAALIGGGKIPLPGEISLAHGGVLFLDELAEFAKPVLEVLRQPLEERQIHISRSQGNYVFPANFILAAAMNPCPCGNYPDMGKCNCTEGQIRQYLGHISQPFLDRIDMCMEVPVIPYEDLSNRKRTETSKEMRTRVCVAREIQKERFENSEILTNSMIPIKEMERYCHLGSEEEQLMKKAFTTLSLTARSYHKILRVARTIADLEGQENIRSEHIKEAISYRTIDKKYWGG